MSAVAAIGVAALFGLPHHGGGGSSHASPAAANRPVQAGNTLGRSKIAFATWRNGNAVQLYTINADGTGLRRVLSDTGGYLTGPWAAWPALSPDGRKIAFQTGPGWPIDVVNANGTARHQVAPIGERPTWSPDGTKVAYSVNFAGIYVVGADGGARHRLTRRGAFPAWSPDGTKIAYSCVVSPPSQGICVMNADGNGQHLLAPASGFLATAWSPDGTEIAYLSGFPDVRVYLMNADGSETRRLPPHIYYKNQDCNLAWSPDGTRIAFSPGGGVDEPSQFRQADDPGGAIYLMNTNGKGVVRLKGTSNACGISWQHSPKDPSA